jgi:hypothetical protein
MHNTREEEREYNNRDEKKRKLDAKLRLSGNAPGDNTATTMSRGRVMRAPK